VLSIVFGIFFLLHGLVHLLYMAQSARIFELQPGMVWPDGSWAFTGLIGNETTRILASVSFILAAISFAAGGIGIFTSHDWWRPVIIGSAVFSAILIILFWDGRMQMLSNNGIFGLLINIAILVALLAFRWPRFAF
jgi:hypothetical protein